MRYSDSTALEKAYELIATLYAIEFQASDSAERAMTISAALGELGEDRSWASVWWAYGVIHHDLSDEGFARALELLARVDRPAEARAAALMLRAEIKLTQAVYRDAEPDDDEQVTMLSEAAKLAPDWPNVRVRLARALCSAGEVESARAHAEAAVAFAGAERSDDPFDIAITGMGLRPGWASDELKVLGLLRD
jgi:tetratricopeptide (TPR) repeat protein